MQEMRIWAPIVDASSADDAGAMAALREFHATEAGVAFNAMAAQREQLRALLDAAARLLDAPEAAQYLSQRTVVEFHQGALAAESVG